MLEAAGAGASSSPAPAWHAARKRSQSPRRFMRRYARTTSGWKPSRFLRGFAQIGVARTGERRGVADLRRRPEEARVEVREKTEGFVGSKPLGVLAQPRARWLVCAGGVGHK